ncbi:NUDIX hydrolase [Paenibacillus senegalensis]|uniref:NUDIX hydrolase n=1 Tax=Paenibacillus senegalensis TaxID=1465766 RepID=UPI0002892F54|nr:NUDIX hydrolase [Paenibacillus senegalensis]
MELLRKHRITASAAVLNERNELLVIRNADRGWELPGGHLEQDESLPEAVIREVREETGIDMEITRFCGISQQVDQSLCCTWWLGKPIGGTPTTTEESVEVAFLPLEKVLELFEEQGYKEELIHILDTSRQPFCLIIS